MLLLQVPQDYYKTLTPGFQQWWTIKADNFDSIIMFKVIVMMSYTVLVSCVLV